MLLKIIVPLLLLLLLGFLLYKIFSGGKSKTWLQPSGDFPRHWRKILMENVSYYNALNETEKPQFEFEILEFLANITITPVGDVKVSETDKVLIASSAVIPIFAFPDWKYYNLEEVLLYPNAFNHQFETSGKGRNIAGMVGTGYMEGKMILSKPALIEGFANDKDGRNTAIHEFIHLVDKKDNLVDGLPDVLMERLYALPWFDLIDKKIDEIRAGKSDIRDYGGTSRIEFFAVLGEYFFEKPQLLKKRHPELYVMLVEIFDQHMAEREIEMKKVKIGRNDLCYCGSGKKFKKCCDELVAS